MTTAIVCTVTIGLHLFFFSAFAVDIMQGSQSDFAHVIDEVIEPNVENGTFSNVSIAVVNDGKPILIRGYGFADQAIPLKLDPNQHLIRPGSISKILTGVAVMQLKDLGLIDLDADINKYLDFKIPDHPSGPVTMRHLMTHRAGFEDVLRDLMTNSSEQLINNEQWLKRWIPDRVFATNVMPAYSNYGAALAGYIVERVSKIPFEQYVESHIFQPLEMRHSSFQQPVPANLLHNISKVYDKSGSNIMPFDYISPTPSGALSTTAGDMALFMAAFLTEKDNPEMHILQRETREEMLSYSVRHVEGMDSMSLGFIRSDEEGHPTWGHSGNTRSYHSHLLLIPKFKAGIFISIGSTASRAASYKLREDLISAFVSSFPLAKADTPIPPPNSVEAKRRAKEVAGYYQSSRASFSSMLALLEPFNRLEIRNQGNGDLLLPAFTKIDNTPWLWREIKPYLWQQVDGKERLSVITQGGYVILSIGALAPVQAWYKVDDWLTSDVLLSAWCIAIGLLLYTILKFVYLLCRQQMESFQFEGVIPDLFIAVCALIVLFGLYLLDIALDRAHNFEPSDILTRVAQVLCFFSFIGSVGTSVYLMQSFRSAMPLLTLVRYASILLAFVFVSCYLAFYNAWKLNLYY